MMTESQFMSEACIGAAINSRPAEDPDLIFPTLIKFLHANGHHDVARVIEGLENRFHHLKANQMPFGV